MRKDSFYMNMITKIEKTLSFIRKYKFDAEKYGGFKLMFSGGKDSQVLYDLMKKSGVKFTAYYCVTTNDPPENVYFIRKEYPDVIFIHPKSTFLQLILKKGVLPTRKTRYCCKILKESAEKGFIVTGVRREESITRRNYVPIEFNGHKTYSAEKMRKNRKVHFRPILEWMEDEIWEYIEENSIPVNPCYDVRGRVGCLFCPFASKKGLLYNKKQYPLFYRNLMNTIKKGMKNGKFQMFNDSEEVWDWWVSKLSIKKYKLSKKQLSIDFN